jgi:putative aldouronate transport system permease protein
LRSPRGALTLATMLPTVKDQRLQRRLVRRFEGRRAAPVRPGAGASVRSRVSRNFDLYLFLAPTVLYFLIFHYGPMYGVLIAFKDFIPSKGILRSPWVGWEHFERFFRSYQFWTLLGNTLILSLYNLAICFPLPVAFALLLNHVRSRGFKKIVQTVTYAPHFISVVVLVSLLFVFCSPRIGLVNIALRALGGKSVFFLSDPAWFRHLYVISSAWQTTGWSSIVYLAALTGISPDLYESAAIDGAGRMQKTWHIDLPGILETLVVMLVLAVGNMMSLGFEKAFLMQTSTNIDTSEIIPTYVYKVGLIDLQYGFSTAVGLFNNVINLVLLILSNQLTRRLNGTGLW